MMTRFLTTDGKRPRMSPTRLTRPQRSKRLKRFKRLTRFVLWGLVLSLAGGSSGCAYRLGQGSRGLPGGYRQIAIPIFKNKTQEVGVEVAFTQALQEQFLRSKAAEIVDDARAEVRVEGTIASISYLPESRLAAEQGGSYMPQGTVVAKLYRVLTVVDVAAIRRSDGEVLWRGTFNGERTYNAPFVTLSGVNSVNPLYNLSARRQNLESMANDMMIETHGRMTENF